MATETTKPRADAGFTIIEVLIAMVILAVGLLTLEGLGISAARTTRRADVQSSFTTVAAGEIEEAVAKIRQDPTTATNTNYSTTASARVYVTITSAAIPSTLPALTNYTVTVRVIPSSTAKVIAQSDSVVMVSNVIR